MEPGAGAQRADARQRIADVQPQLTGARVGALRAFAQSRVTERVGGQVGEDRVVALFGPVLGEFGGEQVRLGGLAGFAEAAVAVAEPPTGLHHGTVAVPLRVEAREGGLKDHGGLLDAALTEQQAAEPEPRPGSEPLALRHRVGPVRRLQRVLRGLLVLPVPREGVGEQEPEPRVGGGVGVRCAVRERRARRTHPGLHVAQVQTQFGEPRVGIDGVPRQRRLLGDTGAARVLLRRFLQVTAQMGETGEAGVGLGDARGDHDTAAVEGTRRRAITGVRGRRVVPGRRVRKRRVVPRLVRDV
ncbi:hypothetical protein, partial [Streptomyces sp. SPB78]|uniref:hypothetical protein n=1 Tax=Streptomyces sp. (strain SPB78) TaxID=591157 RepID=UPI0001B56F0E